MIDSGIRQDNTWLVVDPIIGCRNDCQYCFLQCYGKSRTAGAVLLQPSEAVERLLAYWAFSDVSVPMLGTETDMFMSRRNAKYTAEFLRAYDARAVTNPLALCTKCPVPDDFIEVVRSCTVVRGLNLNPALQQRAWFWPEVEAADIDFARVVSTWPRGWRSNLEAVLCECPEYPVFLKNSCALAYVLGRPEWSGTLGLPQCQGSWCPESQRRLCREAERARVWPTEADVTAALLRIGLKNEVVCDAAARTIKIIGTMNHEQVACITQRLGRRVSVEKIESQHEWGGYVLGYEDLELPWQDGSASA